VRESKPAVAQGETMKKLVTTFALLAICSASAFAANQVRVSQVYGGGGSGTAAYFDDYVELFNSGGTPVNLSGWTIEYGSATGNWGSSALNIFTFPAGATIAPCSYVLVGLSNGGGGAPLPVTPDYTGTNTLSGTSGKIALFSTGTGNANVACGAEAGPIVDKVAYGTANCAEGTAVPALTSLSAAIRKQGGLTDTDNNSADFTVETSFAPHNSHSPANTQCLATPSETPSWGKVKSLYR
jgi:hypothetical protein